MRAPPVVYSNTAGMPATVEAAIHAASVPARECRLVMSRRPLVEAVMQAVRRSICSAGVRGTATVAP